TTLSAMATQALRHIYSGEMDTVMAISLRDDVTVGGFLENFLCRIFQQLQADHTQTDASEDYMTKHQTYLNARSGNSPERLRIQLLREAIHLRLNQLSRAFLIIDDVDRCSAAASLLLEKELSDMAAHGLKTFLTSRVPSLRLPRKVQCDSCPKNGTEIIVYWKCKGCVERGLEPEKAHVLCQVCRDGKKLCNSGCDPSNFVQPFDYVEVNLYHHDQFNRYIDWDFEREHGDLGLGSGTQSLPPHSELGKWLTEPQNYEALKELPGKIVEQAEMNISLARLRLDSIHRAHPSDVINPTVADVLPANIVAFFDAGMKRIEEQASPQRALGLRVIAAVTNFDFDRRGLGFEVLDEVLRNAERPNVRHEANRTHSAPVMSTTPLPKKEREDTDAHVLGPRLREMLHATRGFVVVKPFADYPMVAYCKTFHMYAKENYNEALMQAREAIHFGRIRFGASGLGCLAESGTMAICKRCRENVLESNKTWDYHHINTDTFNDAADSDCIFCRKLGGFVKELDFKPRVDAFYRWTMRETAQIRETKSYISITFRPVSSLHREGEMGDQLPEVCFDMFPEEDLGPIPSAESFGDRTDSEASRRQMKTWLQDCIDNHRKCKARHPDRTFMPTRVLDIGVPGAGSPSHIRIIHTKEETIEEKDRRFFKSTGIPWEKSSETTKTAICSNKNFSEAITIARDLRIRYIWIDSVCIIQNDTDDWEAEAKLMHKVYRNSYCNLAAADSKDCHGGLFRVRANDVVPAKFVSERFSRRFGNRSWRIVSSDLWDRELLGSPLYTRGWVFQERMLSPRLLQFGHDQLFWDCATISACEALPAGFPLSLDEKAATDRYWRQRLQEADISVRSPVKVSEGSLEKLWKNVVRTYTSCNLTKHTDKSNALWGIAKLSRDILRQEYAHGLWSNSLEEQLAWRVAGGPKVVEFPTEEAGEKQNQAAAMIQKTLYQKETSFPSWSWSYLDVPIQVVPRFRERHRFYKVTDHSGGNIRFQFENPFRGWLPKETVTLSEKFENMAIGSDNGDKYRKAQPASTWEPDERSKLISDKIPVQGHICRGTLMSISGKEGWVIAVDVIRGNAVIEAFPDIQPSHNEISCEFLVLAAPGVKFDELGCEIGEVGEVGDAEDADYAEDDDETEEELDDDEIEDEKVEYEELEDDNLEDDDRFVAGNDGDIHYSGVGILVKRVGVDQLMRFGAVTFRQICLRDWIHFRLACGASVDRELDAQDGVRMWLV
ncbi:heterokaryon incompatibility protein, partial [Colletotrichum asianum]